MHLEIKLFPLMLIKINKPHNNFILENEIC